MGREWYTFFSESEMNDYQGTTTWSEFLQSLANGQLWGRGCRACGNLEIFPRSSCNSCSAQQFDPILFTGKGRIDTFTYVFVTSKSMVSKGYGVGNPYCSGIVTLNEGPKIPAIIITGKLEGTPNNLVGAPVIFEGCEIDNNSPTFKFRMISS